MGQLYGKSGIQGVEMGNIENTYERKTSVLARKRCIYNINSSINISKNDTILITSYAWKKNFVEEESDRTDIAVHGWNLLNYNLLNHVNLEKNMEVLSCSTKKGGSNQIDNKELTNMGLNFRSGYDGFIAFELLQLAKRDRKMIRRVNKNKEN